MPPKKVLNTVIELDKSRQIMMLQFIMKTVNGIAIAGQWLYCRRCRSYN